MKEKYIITVQKKIHLPEKVWPQKHGFWNIERSNRQACFPMTLNATKSSADSFLKIKTNNNRARFLRNQQNSEKFDSETSKL